MEMNYKKLLRLLETSADTLTSQALANRLGISSRSVINYVSGINSTVPGLIVSSNNGYRLQHNLWKNVEHAFSSTKKSLLPQTSAERINFLILRLLTSNEMLSLVEFSETVHVSVEAVKKDLATMQRHFKDSNLSVHTKGGSILISGDEKELRNLLSNSISQNFSYTRLSVHQLQKIFSELPVENIQNALAEIISEQHLFINDSLRVNLMRDLLVVLTRVKLGHFVSTSSNSRPVQPVTPILIQRLEILCNVTFPECELLEFQQLIFSYLLPKDFAEMSFAQIEQLLPTCSLTVLAKIIDCFRTQMPFFQLTERFLVRFALNLHNLLSRKEAGRITVNPQLPEIKQASPFVFACTSAVLSKSATLTNINFNENEIGYLSVHVGLALQKQQTKNFEQITCGLLITPYFDYAPDLKRTLLNRFHDDIRIVAQSESETDLASLAQTQLVFSTVPLENNFPTDWLIVDPFLSPQNLERISRYICSKRAEIRETILRDFLTNQSHIDPPYSEQSWTFFDEFALSVETSTSIEETTLAVHKRISSNSSSKRKEKSSFQLVFPPQYWEFAKYIADNTGLF